MVILLKIEPQQQARDFNWQSARTNGAPRVQRTIMCASKYELGNSVNSRTAQFKIDTNVIRKPGIQKLGKSQQRISFFAPKDPWLPGLLIDSNSEIPRCSWRSAKSGMK